jgi:hypothetical protein
MEEQKQIITACPFLDLFHMEANSKLQYWEELRGQPWTALSMDKDHQAVVLEWVCPLDETMLQGKACCNQLQNLITEIASYHVYIQASPWSMSEQETDLVIAVNWI